MLLTYYLFHTQHKDAVKEFKKSKNFKGLVLLKEQEGKYNDAVNLLVDNGRRDEALECSSRYENEGHTVRSDLQASSLALRFAKEICDQPQTQKSRNRLAKLVKFMKDPTDCVYYLKRAKKYHEAYSILCNESRYDEARRICAAQGWTDDGLKLAEEKRNEKWTLRFIFQKAIAALAHDGKVDSGTITRLHSLKNSSNDQAKAKALLLLGNSGHDFFFCRKAFDIYLSTHNAAGCLEAFNLMIQHRIKGSKSTEVNIKQILDACNKATDITQVMDSVINHRHLSPVQEHTLTQLEEFYGLQRQFNQNIYFLTPGQQVWVQFYVENSAFDTDSDGMIQIDSTKVVKVIYGHVQNFLKRWKENDELQLCQLFWSRLNSFQFHKQLEDNGCVRKSFKMMYQGRMLYEYLRLCCSGLEMSDFANGEIKGTYVSQLLSNFFKPSAALYLGVTKGQMEWIAKSPSAAAAALEQHSVKILQKSDRDFLVDDWLEAWCILTILGKDKLLRQLDKCTAHVNTLPVDKIPHVYVHDRESGGHVHVFSLWIRSCSLIQKDSKVITSCKVVLHCFLGVIARRRSIRPTLSITNLVNILTIHTTALLSLTALCNYMQRKPSNVLVPNSFERVLNTFDNIGKLLLGNDCKTVLDASMNDEKVLKAYEKMKLNSHAVQNLQNEITRLLWQILDMLLGRHSPHFHPLSDAMKSEVCIKRRESRHCLLLALVLFGNLAEIDKQCTQHGLQHYHVCINNAFKSLKDSTDDESQTLRKTYSMFSSSSNTTGFFLAINHLITTVDPHDFIVRINAKQRPAWKFELERAQMRHFPAHPLLPTLSQPVQPHRGNTEPGMGEQATGLHMSSQPQKESSTNKSEIPASSLQQALDLTFKPQTQMLTLPAHPAGAYLTSSTSNPQDKVPTSDVQHRGVGTTADDVSQFSPPSTPTGAVLITQTSMEPLQEDVNIGEDEDLKNLTLLTPFVLDRQSSEITTEQGNSAIKEELSMVDEHFCQFCGIPLKPDETAAPIAEQDEEEIPNEHSEVPPEEHGGELIAEPYALHCVSEKHVNNMKAHDQFNTLKKEYYEPLREKMNEVLQDLKRFENENFASNLRTTVQVVEKELESNEGALKDIMLSAKWSVGVSQIERDMLGRMDSLISTAEDKLTKERVRVQREQRVREQAASVQMSADDDDNQSDGGDGSQSEEEIIKKVDADEARDKERQRRRDRKYHDKTRRHHRKK